MTSPLVPATPAFDAAGTPYSPEYGDVYHSADSGPGQARHVFLGGNGFPSRLREPVKRDETQSRVEFSP